MLIGATLLLAGKWAASQYPDYVKSTARGQTAEPYSSTLNEPWSHVSELTNVFCYHIFYSQIRFS